MKLNTVFVVLAFAGAILCAPVASRAADVPTKLESATKPESVPASAENNTIAPNNTAKKAEAEKVENAKLQPPTGSKTFSEIIDLAAKQLDTSPEEVKKDLVKVGEQLQKDAKDIKDQAAGKLPIIAEDLKSEFKSRLKDLPAMLPQMLADRSVLPIWSDEIVFHDLRVQMNCRNGECRLIDQSQAVLASGKIDDCSKELQSLRTNKKLPGLKKHVVLLLHGLGQSSKSLNDMATALGKNEDWEVISLGYPSGEADVAAHAKSLASVISHLDDAEQIDLVAHSLGNIVIRHYWADQTDAANNKTPDPRIKRIVMIGPPNKGAVLAQKYGANKMYENFSGKSGKQLTRGWDELEKKLATPSCEFGIIAGGKNDDVGFNPLIPGDDDLLVTVEETKLVGARDFLLLPITHAGQLHRAEIQEYTRKFLENGYFISEKERKPIEAKKE